MNAFRRAILLVQLPIPPPGPQPVEGNVPLAAACHPAPSYLDWYYSLHPGHLPGAKRLMVLAQVQERHRLGRRWIESIGDYATLLWRGGEAAAEDLDEHEYLL